MEAGSSFMLTTLLLGLIGLISLGDESGLVLIGVGGCTGAVFSCVASTTTFSDTGAGGWLGTD